MVSRQIGLEIMRLRCNTLSRSRRRTVTSTSSAHNRAIFNLERLYSHNPPFPWKSLYLRQTTHFSPLVIAVVPRQNTGEPT